MNQDDAIARARRASDSAQLLLGAGDLAGAVNRAYYAMFYAAHAALAHEGVAFRGTKHGSLVARFGQQLVNTGRLPARLGRSFSRALELRAVGDYGNALPERTDAEAAVASAEAFVKAIEALLAT